jgi:hypothetical protein
MLQLAYYIVLVIIIFSLGFAFKKSMASQKFLNGYYITMFLWVGIITLLAIKGVYQTNDMPPRLVLLGVLPAFALIIYFFIAQKVKPLIDNFHIRFTIYFQSFRIVVELLIFGAVLKGLAPEIVSFNGRNYDILAGLTAPLVGWAYSRSIIGKSMLLIWNIFCLMLLANIVFIFISLLINPLFWGYESTPISMGFMTIPYVYIAAVYMPVAVFLHIMCIKKIITKR